MCWRRPRSAVLVWILLLVVSLVSVSVSLYGSSTRVLSLWRVDNACPGATVTLWAKVQNTGSSTLGYGCRVKFWINGIGGKVHEGNISCSGLSPGNSKWYKYSWRISSSAKAGTYKYWAIVESSGQDISKWSAPQSFRVTEVGVEKRDIWKFEKKGVWECRTQRTGGAYIKICSDGRIYEGEIKAGDINRIVKLNTPWPLNTFFLKFVAKIASLLQKYTGCILPGADVTEGLVAEFSMRVDGYMKLSGTLFGLKVYGDMRADGSGRTGVEICPKTHLCIWIWMRY